MSLLTPVKVPVKVYRWDDAGAPALDKTAGCMMTIFKACLVTGYGTKEPAGWTMPFEDTAAGVKVLRPEISPHTDFYLRLFADTGTEMAAQVYLNMTDVNTGDLKLQCTTAFKYAKGTNTGKWILIASPRGIWFFCEQYAMTATQKRGSYFTCGDLSSGALGRPVYLQHSGGTRNDGYYATIFGHFNGAIAVTDGVYNSGKLLNGTNVSEVVPFGLSDGYRKITNLDYVADAFVSSAGEIYRIVGAFVPLSGSKYVNAASNTIYGSDEQQHSSVNFGTGGIDDSNIYVATDYWRY